MQELEIRDIKPLIAIPDSTLYIYYGLWIVGLLLLLAIVFFVGLKLWRARKTNQKKEYLAKLKAVDWGDAKSAAYNTTTYGRALVHDERTSEIYTQLLAALEQYKYKKEVDAADAQTLKLYNLFVQVCDESI